MIARPSFVPTEDVIIAALVEKLYVHIALLRASCYCRFILILTTLIVPSPPPPSLFLSSLYLHSPSCSYLPLNSFSPHPQLATGSRKLSHLKVPTPTVPVGSRQRCLEDLVPLSFFFPSLIMVSSRGAGPSCEEACVFEMSRHSDRSLSSRPSLCLFDYPDCR